jgi:N-acyl-D-amino-acid deacylase
MLDVLIRNGRIVDGTGSPWFKADLGIRQGRIVAVRPRIRDEAARVIDAAGLIVAPGFIDMHTHSDLRVFAHPEEDSKLLQGITTALIGQDGLSVAPIDDANKAPMMKRVSGLLGTYLTEWAWNSMGEFLGRLDSLPPATNTMMLVPHGAIRATVLGWENRPATPDEIERMKQILARAFEDGGVGFSTGLIYPPGMYADRAELTELCRVTAEREGFFVVHLRNEGDYVLDSIREVGEICLEAGCPLHISHLKVAGKANWGKAAEILGLLESYQQKGVEITFDQYPYVAGSTMLDAVIPPRFHSAGTQALLTRLKDPTVREEVRQVQDQVTPERWDNWVDLCGWDGIWVTAVKTEANRFAEGKSIADLSKATGKRPVDVVCDLLIEEDDAVTMTCFYGCEEDVTEIMRSDCMTVCSDGIVGGKPHPRVYNTCARLLGKYVREEKVLSLPQAIRRMTSFPARRLGLQDRGLLREGMVADITIFDPDTIIDKGTYTEPNQYPIGISHVLVAGRIAVENGKLTDARAGRVLRRRYPAEAPRNRLPRLA